MKIKLSIEQFIKYIEVKRNSFLSEKNILRKEKLKKIIFLEINWFIKKASPDKNFKFWANQILKEINS